jgi:sarcosine oxidase
MSGTTNFETIVIGLGAMGSAAIYQLSKKGNKVLGIDQFAPPHAIGSSHGDSRITRQAIGEGHEYVPLSLRSYEIWKELERKTGKQLLTITGGLIIGKDSYNPLDGNSRFLQATINTAQKFNISHAVFPAAELKKRFPKFQIEDDYLGYYEEKAGFLRPELCVEAQIELAGRQGAQIHLNEKVRHLVQSTDGSIEVKTDKGAYKANKIIVSAGPWAAQFFPMDAEMFRVYRQVSYWFDIPDDITPYLPAHFPVFIFAGTGKHDIYGFPAIDGRRGGLKVAFVEYSINTTPENAAREISKQEIERAYYEIAVKHLPGLSMKCLRAAACLYTVTPDSKFVIDTHPKYPQIIIASPCSGHGFKHSAAIGEALAELIVEGQSHFDLSAFRIDRFIKNQI